MDRTLKQGEEDPSVITEINVLAVLLYAQGKIDKVIMNNDSRPSFRDYSGVYHSKHASGWFHVLGILPHDDVVPLRPL